MAAKRICPECGYPLTNETVCPECGCNCSPIESKKPLETERGNDVSNDSNSKKKENDSLRMDSESDFNEAPKPYSPFSPLSWYFRDPAPLSNYPQRGDFGRKHRFLGWLFDAWHLDPRSDSDKRPFVALNNFFYFCNLIFKMLLYPILWTFFKIWGFLVAYLILDFILAKVYVAEMSALLMSALLWLTIIAGYALVFFGTIVYICGLGASLHRYWSEIYRTFYRMSHRYWNSMYSGVKQNTLNN